MIKLTLQDFDAAYHIFKISFPKEELRPYDKMKTLFINHKLNFYGMKKEDELISCIIVWEFDEFVFLENFATKPEFRGNGVGKQLLNEICNKFHKPVILEAEEPYDQISLRRIGFYERNDFILTSFGYKQPPFYDTGETYYLKILSYKNLIDKDLFHRMKEMIFEEIYEKNLVD